MPPIIRRQPFKERIKALLNPYDFLLYLSEELHESAIDEKLRGWTVPIGGALNIMYMIARANSANDGSSRGNDDLFSDFEGRSGSGWFSWFASFTAHFLALLSVFNALYTFTRTRKYRLFETPIDMPPSTPSARRVKVEDSPASSSPLSYFSQKFAATTAASRAHPDDKNDVWELSIWDPKPLHLSLFAFFSPGHVLVYWLFLPTSPLDPRPSVTVFTTIILAFLTTAQLLLFQTFHEQKAKDDRLLNKEVLNEYDTKFVHPSLNRPCRDVGTQSRESSLTPAGKKSREVDVYTPTTIVNRGFRVNPNPSYAAHLGKNIDPADLYAETPATRQLGRLSGGGGVGFGSPTPATGSRAIPGGVSMGMQTQTQQQQQQNFPSRDQDFYAPSTTSPLKQQPVHRHPAPTSNYRTTSTSTGEGGSLGVFTHAASPLRKSGTGLLRNQRSNGNLGGGGGGGGGSPLKRMSVPGPVFGAPSTAAGGGERRKTAGGGLDYLGRPIKASAGEERRERSDRDRAVSGNAGDDGLRARFGGLRDGGDNVANGGRRERGPY